MSKTTPLPGHPHIARKHGELQVEGLALSALAQEHGTPLFVYSKQWMLDALAAYQRGYTTMDLANQRLLTEAKWEYAASRRR